jgi:hypothetical protein
MFFKLKVCSEQKRMELEIVNSNYVDKGLKMECSVLLNFECNLSSLNNHSNIPRQIFGFRFSNKIMK